MNWNCKEKYTVFFCFLCYRFSLIVVTVMPSSNMRFFYSYLQKQMLINNYLNDCSYPCTVVSTDSDSLELWDLALDRCFRCIRGKERTNHRHSPLRRTWDVKRYRLGADQLETLLPKVWQKNQKKNKDYLLKKQTNLQNWSSWFSVSSDLLTLSSECSAASSLSSSRSLAWWRPMGQSSGTVNIDMTSLVFSSFNADAYTFSASCLTRSSTSLKEIFGNCRGISATWIQVQSKKKITPKLTKIFLNFL